MSNRNFTDEELEALAQRLEELIVERMQINIGKAVLSVAWKSCVTVAAGFWAWFHLNPKGN